MPRSAQSATIMPATYGQTQVLGEPAELHFDEEFSPENFVPGLDATELDTFDTEVKLEPYDYSFSSPDAPPREFSAANGTPAPKTASTKAKSPRASGAAKSRQAHSSASASASSPENADSDKNHMKASDRRAEQNRQAQKTFRENRKKYIKELEDKLEEAKQVNHAADLLRQENDDLRNIITSLQSENERLKKQNSHINFTWNPNGPIPNFEENGYSYPPKSDNSPPAVVPQADSSSNDTPPGTSPASTAPLSSPPSSSSYDTPSPNAVPFSPTLSFLEMSTANSAALPADYYKQPQFLNPQEPAPYMLGSDITLLSQHGIDWDIDTLLVPAEPSSDDQLLAPNLPVPTSNDHETMKRTLSEASFYNNMPLPFKPVTLSKDPEAARDRVETEICDLFKKIHCKDKNPELTHGTKYIKKAM